MTIDEDPTPTEAATLGGGCFWCLEAAFREIEGVVEVTPGYAGGHATDPTYKQVCAGRTGHAEVVRVAFDPSVVSYEDLLGIFFTIHDPTTPDRQGADVGPQYRSIVLYHDADQHAAVEATIARFEADAVWDAPIVTEVVPLGAFYPAESYHHRYFERHPNEGYCRVVIAPKVARVRQHYAARLRH